MSSQEFKVTHMLLGKPAQRSAPRRTNREALGPRKRLGWLALVLFLLISAWLTWYGRNQRSARNLETFPGDSIYANMPLLGQCYLQGQNPFFYEDWPHVEQVAFFSGWKDARVPDNWWPRPYPSFFATLLAPVLGPIDALLLVNWSAWALCAWAAWRLSKRLFSDNLAALLAILLVSGGMGMVFHVGDYSSHLPGFAGYYLGVYFLYTTGIPFVERTWRVHLMIGAFLALNFLVYTWYGFVLLAVYFLSAIRYNRWWHVASAVVLPLTTLPIWKAVLRVLGVEFPVTANEGAVMIYTIRWWWDNVISQPSWETVHVVVNIVRQIGWFDSPLVLLLGVLSCLVLPRRRGVRWFGVLLLVLPVLGDFALSPANGDSRGYFTYGTTIWLYCWLGQFLASGLRGRPWPQGRDFLGAEANPLPKSEPVSRYSQRSASLPRHYRRRPGPHLGNVLLGQRTVQFAAGLILLVTAVTHFGWSTAHFQGWLGPIKAYISGWAFAQPYFTHPRSVILSMTGLERTPICFGGEASLSDAGAYVAVAQAAIDPDSVSWFRALTRCAPLFGLLALLGIAAVTTWRGRLVVAAAVLSLALMSSGLSRLTFHAMPTRTNVLGSTWNDFPATDYPVVIPREGKLAYRAELSQAFLATLGKEMSPGDQLCFFLGPEGVGGLDRSVVEFAVAAGPVALPLQSPDSSLALEPREALAALHQAGSITVEVTNHRDNALTLAGWQRPDLPGRQLQFIPAAEGDAAVLKCLPAIEIRLLRPDGSIKVAGF